MQINEGKPGLGIPPGPDPALHRNGLSQRHFTPETIHYLNRPIHMISQKKDRVSDGDRLHQEACPVKRPGRRTARERHRLRRPPDHQM